MTAADRLTATGGVTRNDEDWRLFLDGVTSTTVDTAPLGGGVVSTSEIDTATGEVVVLLDENEALKLTAEIKAQASTLWLKLEQAFQGQAWRALKYKSWAAYLDAEFDISRSRGYQLVSHATAVRSLAGAAGVEVSTMVDTFGERETRGLDIDQVCEIVRDVVMGLPKDATTATRLGLVEQITIRLKPPVEPTKRTTPKKAKPADEVPADPDPDLSARMDAAIAKAQAKVEAEAADRDDADKSEQEGSPAAPPAHDPGKAGAGSPSDAAAPGTSRDPGQHAAHDPAGVPGEDGPATVLPGPELPGDWAKRLADATYLLSIPAETVAALASHDDIADLTDLAAWLLELSSHLAIKENA